MGENQIKRCIFHIPNYINKESRSGSGIRPMKMLQGFLDNGYSVDIIMGYGSERRRQIKEIKKRIIAGVSYDFVYSESSTMPTLLTEKNHVPLYPFLDFGFLNFCKKKGIKIGLFYRDIYWKFPVYKEEVPWYKRVLSIPMYKYDLRQYKKLLDRLYLPSLLMSPYIGLVLPQAELPPGCEWKKDMIAKKKAEWNKKALQHSQPLKLFYVGGVGTLYDLTKLLSVVKKIEDIELTVCCREDEWIKNRDRYASYLSDQIHIIHKSGKELDFYYERADISMLFFSSSGYRRFAMPVKLFEYIGNLTPVIAVKDSSAGKFVEDNDVGWAIDYDEKALEDLIIKIQRERSWLERKNNNMEKVLLDNTWKKRAETVIKDLKCE